MILVCVGPDLFQARQKVLDLERLYTEKYDPSGVSLERVEGVLGPRELAAKLQGGGLFAQKTAVRGTDVLASWKAADWKQANEIFQAPNEDAICLLLEQDLDATKEAMIRAWPKGQVYRYEPRSEAAFVAWAKQYTEEQGATWDTLLERFARGCAGDAWTFTRALPRWKASKTLPALAYEAGSPYAMLEGYLRSGKAPVELREATEDMSSLLAQQARQVVRSMEGVGDARTPSWARARFERLTPVEREAVYRGWARSLEMLLAIRGGKASSNEWITLL